MFAKLVPVIVTSVPPVCVPVGGLMLANVMLLPPPPPPPPPPHPAIQAATTSGTSRNDAMVMLRFDMQLPSDAHLERERPPTANTRRGNARAPPARRKRINSRGALTTARSPGNPENK